MYYCRQIYEQMNLLFVSYLTILRAASVSSVRLADPGYMNRQIRKFRTDKFGT